MVQKGRAEAVTSDGNEAYRQAAALHGGKVTTSGHDGARQGAHKHRGVVVDMACARNERKEAERAGDMDRELAGALTMAGRRTGCLGLYLRQWHVRKVRQGEASCCGASAASRSDGSA
jgi:hypothetical protein